MTILIFEYSNFQHVPQIYSWLRIQVVIKKYNDFCYMYKWGIYPRWFTKMWNMISQKSIEENENENSTLCHLSSKTMENPYKSTTFKLDHKVWVTKIVSPFNNSITPTNALVISTSTNFNGALKPKALPHVNAILTSVKPHFNFKVICGRPPYTMVFLAHSKKNLLDLWRENKQLIKIMQQVLKVDKLKSNLTLLVGQTPSIVRSIVDPLTTKWNNWLRNWTII